MPVILSRLFAASLLLGLVSSFVATPASAATTKTVTTKFSTTKQFYTDELSLCLKVTVSGTLEATATTGDLGHGGKAFILSKPKVKSPKVVINSYTDCYSTKAAKLSGITFHNEYYATQCSANASGSLSISSSGFGASVSVTPKCDEVLLADNYSDDRSVADSSYSQSNSGTVLTWKDAKSERHAATPGSLSICIQPYVRLRAYKGSTDDSPSFAFSAQCVPFAS